MFSLVAVAVVVVLGKVELSLTTGSVASVLPGSVTGDCLGVLLIG